VADNADRAAEQDMMDMILSRRPKPPHRTAPGIHCLGCGDEIPEARRKAFNHGVPFLCVDCQDDAERAMGR
jgi:RNA polymerase-binding transcription factor DksA